MCVDYRQLNKVTEFDPFPMPQTEEILTKLNKAKFFTTLDLARGYFQVPLSDNAKPLTAFKTPSGTYQWKVMSFGLVNSPATFNRMMAKLFGHRKDVICYLDDMCIYNETWEDHLKSLNDIFEIIQQNNLTVKPSKINIGLKEIPFLGYKISNQSIRPIEETVSKILKITVPKTKKQVRSLLGLCNFYRKFLPNFAQIVEPLTNLTKKGQPNFIKWSDECQQALDKIKSGFSKEPILKLPSLSPLRLKGDAPVRHHPFESYPPATWSFVRLLRSV